MARIVHIALKVNDLEKATEFYEKGFGFVEVETGQVRDHTSRHLTDGTIGLALIKYDSEDSAEARASGAGPCTSRWTAGARACPSSWPAIAAPRARSPAPASCRPTIGTSTTTTGSSNACPVCAARWKYRSWPAAPSSSPPTWRPS